MNNASKAHPKEQSIKELFIGQCWSYLRDNFHKFKEANQIKIALELCKKDVPQEFKGGISVTQMPTIQKDGAEVKYNIGQPSLDPSEDP